MPRVDEATVRDVIPTSLEGGSVWAYIASASAWVDSRLVGSGLSDAVLRQVELFLAAHFVTLGDPRIKQGTAADTSESYQRDGEVTEFLKAAAAFDTTGAVADDFIRAGKSRFRGFAVVGPGYAS